MDGEIIQSQPVSEYSTSLRDVREPLVTMDAVQVYVRDERRRVRKILFGISSVFLVVVLVIFAVFLSIGIFVLRNTRSATERIDSVASGVEREVAAMGLEVESVGMDLGSIRDAAVVLSNDLLQVEQVRTAEKQTMQVDLEKFGEWIAVNDRKLLKRLRDAETRQDELLARLEKLSALDAATSRSANQGPDRKSPATSGLAVPKGGSDQLKALAQDPAQTESGTGRGGLGERIVLPNGDNYQGQVVNGNYHGSGIYTFHTGDKVRYTGEFTRGKKSGRGVLVFRSGARYEGAFVHDAMEGSGTFFYTNGDRFEGDFRAGLKHGKGKYTYANEDVYEGEFQRGTMHGEGVLQFSNGDEYRGEFKNGHRIGKATYAYASGGKYIGNFKNGRRHGEGSYEYPDGAYFNGIFNDGKKDGYGVYTFTDGAEIAGIWENDEFQGQ